LHYGWLRRRRFATPLHTLQTAELFASHYAAIDMLSFITRYFLFSQLIDISTLSFAIFIDRAISAPFRLLLSDDFISLSDATFLRYFDTPDADC
jgi:hypothetical protein